MAQNFEVHKPTVFASRFDDIILIASSVDFECETLFDCLFLRTELIGVVCVCVGLRACEKEESISKMPYCSSKVPGIKEMKIRLKAGL